MIKHCMHERLSDQVYEEMVEEGDDKLLLQFTGCLDCNGWIYTGPTISIDLTTGNTSLAKD